MEIMNHYYCIQCGRVMASDEELKHCYFDGNAYINKISEEDAAIFRVSSVPFTQIPSRENTYVEFIGDLRFDPVTGEAVEPQQGKTLSQWQKFFVTARLGAQ